MPLPEDSMIRRFKGVFEAFKKGQSATMIGLPYCGKSSFFRALIESNNQLTQKISNNTKLTFIFIDNYTGEKTAIGFKNYIISSFNQKINQNDQKVDLQTFLNIENYIKTLENNERIVFVIFGIDDYANNYPDLIKVLREMYYSLHSKSANSKNNLCFFFIGEPTILNNPNTSDIQSIIHQNIFYFEPLVSEKLNYVRKRFQQNEIFKLNDEEHKIISKYSGGHYYLYKTISKDYLRRII